MEKFLNLDARPSSEASRVQDGFSGLMYSPESPQNELVDSATKNESTDSAVEPHFEFEIDPIDTSNLIPLPLSSGVSSTVEDNDGNCLFNIPVHYISNSFCSHSGRNKSPTKCPCMMSLKHGHKWALSHSHFMDICAINQEMNLAFALSTDKPLPSYQSHFVTIVALSTRDKMIVNTSSIVSDQTFFKNLYELREHYGVYHDFGYKNAFASAEAPEDTPSFFCRVFDSIKKLSSTAFSTASSFINNCFDTFVSGIFSIVGFVSEKVEKLLQKLLSYLRDKFLSWLDPIGYFTKKALKAPGRLILASSVIILVCIIVDMIGILTYKLCASLIDKLVTSFRGSHVSAQGPPSPTAGLVTLVCLVLGLSTGSFDLITARARKFSILVTAGISASVFASSIFLILPVVVQTAIKEKFGTEKERADNAIEDWIIHAQAILQLSRVSSVIISEEYFSQLNELISEANVLAPKVRISTNGHIFVRHLIRLQDVGRIVTAYRCGKTSRDYPFSIHLYGEPGVGKTLLSSRFALDLFNVRTYELYTRPISSEFWDGFFGAKVVLYDEFLIGPKEKVSRCATEYLELVSTKDFKPPCASVEDPSVGIKGTVAEPRGVITINNNGYFNLTSVGIDNDAIHRRRDFVIHAKMNPKFKHLNQSNSIDITQLTQEEIEAKVWIVFDIYPPNASSRPFANDFTYAQLVAFSRSRLETHEQVCSSLRDTENASLESTRTPSERISDVLRELRGVPNEPLSVFDSIVQAFGDFKDSFTDFFSSFKSEGPSEEEEWTPVKGRKSKKPNKKKNVGAGLLPLPNIPPTTPLETIRLTKKKFQKSLQAAQAVNLEKVHQDRPSSPVQVCPPSYPKNKDPFSIPKIVVTPPSRSSSAPPYDRSLNPFAMNPFSSDSEPEVFKNRCHLSFPNPQIPVIEQPTTSQKMDDRPGVDFSDASVKNFILLKSKCLTTRVKVVHEDCIEKIANLRKQTDSSTLIEDIDKFLLSSSRDSNGNLLDQSFYSKAKNYEGFYYDHNQMDYISNIAHSNVNPAYEHRHRCMGSVSELQWKENNGILGPVMDSATGKQAFKLVPCPMEFSHSHSFLENNHKLLCEKCTTPTYQLITNPPTNSNHPITLLPENYDYDFMGAPPDFKEHMDALYLDLFVKDFQLLWKSPLVLIEDESHFLSCHSPSAAFWASVKVVGAITSFFVLLHAVRRVFRKEESHQEICFSEAQNSPSDYRDQKTSTQSKKSYRFSRPNAQGSVSELLTFSIGNKKMYGLPIKGRTFVTYYHSLLDESGKLLPEGTKITIHWGNKPVEMSLNYDTLKVCENVDLVFVSVHNRDLQLFPNNSRRFWSDIEASSFTSTTGIFDSPDHLSYVSIRSSEKGSYNFNKRIFNVGKCLIYSCKTEKGDCGTPIKSNGNFYPGKILGIHVAGGNNGHTNFGLATIITRDMIKEVLEEDPLESFENAFMSGEGPISDCSGPNLVMVEQLPFSETVHIPRKSKLKQSCLSPVLTFPPKKKKPIMSPLDPRAQGDPLVNMLQDSLQIEHTEVDQKVVDEVAQSLLSNLQENLEWPIGKRRLTFEEALSGIPGKLASMKTSTSPGWPYCKIVTKKGKTSLFSFDANGNLVFDEGFKTVCEGYLQNLESGEEDIHERFVAYLKDELISESKEKEGRVRIIYCANVVANVAYRMLYGSVLCAFNNAHQTTASAVGLNQYSIDMDLIYNYLSDVGNKFIAGDYKNFDKRIHPQFQRAAYQIIGAISEGLSSRETFYRFYEHQCFAPAQFLDSLVHFRITHFSGCFYTTIVNNLINELYSRFFFRQLAPKLFYEDHFRSKVTGDDHIFCISDQASEFISPFKIRDVLSQIGQIYTSDKKDCDLEDSYRTFEEVTFLGAHPRLIDNKYVGALKKATIEECLHWTRNDNMTIRSEAIAVLEMASLWDEDYYNFILKEINNSLSTCLIDKIEDKGYLATQRIVSLRSASSDSHFTFQAQGPPGTNEHSLVQMNARHLVSSTQQGSSEPSMLAMKAVNEGKMDLEFGTNSLVYRKEFEWKPSDPVGIPIAKIDIPFGLLALGEPENVQNMGFDRFVFWHGDVGVYFQVNGMQFQQGLLNAHFVPLDDAPRELANLTSMIHVKMEPKQNATYHITIPYRYMRSVMNTFARTEESLGTLFVTPMSQLISGSDAPDLSVPITVYSSFPNSKFTIPRPLNSSVVTIKKKTFYDTKGVTFEAQGNSSSTNISNNYSNVGGTMPIQGIENVGKSDATQDISPDVDLSIPMPLDNPPLSSGAIPVEQSFPGFSSSYGIRPTRDLQLFPSALEKQHIGSFSPEESKFAYILGQECLLTTIRLRTSDIAGKLLWEIDLNTRLGVSEGSGKPINLVALNKFFFWHSDIEFNFVGVTTTFHTTRLQSVVSYATPQSPANMRNVAFSSNIFFGPENGENNAAQKVLIPFNAQQEFLRTYEGEGVVNPVQDYSLGKLSLYVQNPLVAPDTVSPAIDILVFVRFLNTKVAVPRPMSPFSMSGNLVPTAIASTYYTQLPNFRVDALNPGRAEISFVEIYNNVLTSSLPPGVEVPIAGPPIPVTIYMRESGGFPASFVFKRNVVAMKRFTETTNFILDSSIGPFTNLGVFAQNYAIFGVKRILCKTVPLSAQGPIEETEIAIVTSEETVSAPVTKVTETETPKRHNIPCRIEDGEKFPFCVTDVHEIGRRYVEMNLDPSAGGSLQRNAVIVNAEQNLTVANVTVSPVSEWRNCYAGWFGSVKYRILKNLNGSEISQVMYSPLLTSKSSASDLPIPMVNVAKNNLFSVDGVQPGNSTKILSSATGYNGPIAREVLYPISNTSYVDVSAPCQSHFNFLLTAVPTSTSNPSVAFSSGVVSYAYAGPDNPHLFSAFGDDLRLGIFRPPKTTNFSLTVFEGGVGGFYKTRTNVLNAVSDDNVRFKAPAVDYTRNRQDAKPK